MSGEYSVEQHLVWLENRATLERLRNQQAQQHPLPVTSSSPSHLEEIVAGPIDVVFGRGRGIRDAPGNVNFRRIINSHMQEYNSAARLEKGTISAMVVKKIKAQGGRFLRRNDDLLLEEVSDDIAREKAHHAFRNMRIKKGASAGKKLVHSTSISSMERL